jgi:hypothetical protein
MDAAKLNFTQPETSSGGGVNFSKKGGGHSTVTFNSNTTCLKKVQGKL